MLSSALPAPGTRFRALAFVAASLLGAAGAAQAATNLVRIEDMGFTSNTNAIQTALPGFGSTAGATLDWGPFPGSSRTLLNWLNGYSGRAAAYCGGGTDCTLDLLADAGATVTLDSFWLGGWLNANRQVRWSVIDLATSNVVLADAPVAPNVSGSTGLTVAVGASSSVGLRLLFGPDGFNAGINDISYSVSAVPEPATWALWLAGLGGLVLGVRRRAG